MSLCVPSIFWLVVHLGSGFRIRMLPGWLSRPITRPTSERPNQLARTLRSGQMRGAPVLPAPPNPSRVSSVPVSSSRSPSQPPKLRPPQATEGTSHPRGPQHAGSGGRRQRKFHKILGQALGVDTTLCVSAPKPWSGRGAVPTNPWDQACRPQHSPRDSRRTASSTNKGRRVAGGDGCRIYSGKPVKRIPKPDGCLYRIFIPMSRAVMSSTIRAFPSGPPSTARRPGINGQSAMMR